MTYVNPRDPRNKHRAPRRFAGLAGESQQGRKNYAAPSGKGFAAALIIWATICLAVMGGIMYVAYHFISKWW